MYARAVRGAEHPPAGQSWATTIAIGATLAAALVTAMLAAVAGCASPPYVGPPERTPPPRPNAGWFPDHDGDGVRRERCPTEAEDFDGFEDEDGCPDDDNDRDGIPDLRDACPLDAEDAHDVDDSYDGCPSSKLDRD